MRLLELSRSNIGTQEDLDSAKSPLGKNEAGVIQHLCAQMSQSARNKIAAAQRARWARQRQEKKAA
jgi:hypothetical protein